MHRIDTKTAQKDKFGAGKNGFTRGNPRPAHLPPIWMMTTLICCRKKLQRGGGIRCQPGEGAARPVAYRASCAAVKPQESVWRYQIGWHGENSSRKPLVWEKRQNEM